MGDKLTIKEKVYREYDERLKRFEKQVFGDNMPSNEYNAGYGQHDKYWLRDGVQYESPCARFGQV